MKRITLVEWRFTTSRVAVALVIASVATGLNFGLANAAEKRPSPPMGWNSYTGYSIAVTEEELLKNIDFLSEKLLNYGYDTVTVDNGWFLSVFLSYQQDGQDAPQQERERVVQPVVDHALRINGPSDCGVWAGDAFLPRDSGYRQEAHDVLSRRTAARTHLGPGHRLY